MEGVEDLLPATPAQVGMLFETLAAPEAGVNLGLITARLPADLDIARYQAAWATCIARHQSLRSHFLWEGLSAPVQVVREEAPLTWEHLDWRDLDDTARAHVLEDWRQSGVALDQAPAMRLALAEVAQGNLLIWACHHALIDDWSVDLILGEIETLYHGGALTAAMPFRDYADWLAAREDTADADFWGARMADLESPSRLAFTRPFDQSPNAAHIAETLSLSEAETEALNTKARDLRVTLAAVLSAVWSLVVARMSDSNDLTFGLATTQRATDLQGAHAAVGNFVATLPVRMRMDPAITLRAHIAARASAALQEQNRAAPLLSDLPGGAETTGGPFDTILSINETGPSGGSRDLHHDLAVQNHSSFPLAMIMRPGARLSLTALVDPNRLDAQARGQVLQLTRQALIAAPGALDMPAADLPMASPLLLQGAPLPVNLPSLPELISQHTSAAPAIIDAHETLTYGDLSNRVAALAAQLHAAGARPGDRIGVLLPRGATAVAAFLAAWHIGAAYVPLDPAQPQSRLRDMAQAAKLHTVLTDAAHADLLDSTTIADPSFAGTIPRHSTQGDDPAYVMFTSGSTGRPKGVVISHANLAASTAARPIWYEDMPERFLVVSPFGFDSSVAGIYWTLSTGGTLVVPTAQDVQDPARLVALIKAHQVTHTLCLPSLYDLLLTAAPQGALDSLRCTIVAGEACPDALVSRHHQARPGTRLVNEYGPTEATVWCCAADLKDVSGGVPIGSPIPGVTLTLRDALGRPVPDGLPGLLHVCGPTVSAGYFDADETTSAAFSTANGQRSYATGDLVIRRADGQLVYLGRRDDQVKVRGHRIELTEVEARLLALPMIHAAAVVALPQGTGMMLVAYLRAAQDDAALRTAIKSALPGAYCPAHVVVLDTLPQTPTGKIDRPALTALGVPAATAPQIAPVGETETALATLWQDLLGLPHPPDILTDFFALGGDSLLAMRLVAEVSATFSRPLSLAEMMRAGLTIRDMAMQLDSPPQLAEQGACDWPAMANASQQAMYLAARMNPGQPFFHLTLAAELPGHLSYDTLCRARDALAARHTILRCCFQLQDRVLSLVEAAPAANVMLATSERGALEAALNDATNAPFDLSAAALWRLHAWHLPGGSTAVQLVIHHTISDGWSLDLLMQDLVTALQGESLPPADTGFARFLGMDDTPSDDTRAFWDQTLTALPTPVAQLAMDLPLPSRANPAGHLIRHRLPDDLSQRIKRAAAEHRSSVFALLWAGWGHALHQITGSPHSLVAVSHANRSAGDFAQTVGCFTKALPYPLTCQPDDFRASLTRARDMARAIMAQDDIGVEHLSLPPGRGGPGYLSSFAQVALQYNDFDWTTGTATTAKPLPFEPANTSVFEVSLAWSWRGAALECALLARADLFDPASLQAWLKSYEAALARGVASLM